MIYEYAFRHSSTGLEIYKSEGKHYINAAYRRDALATKFSKKLEGYMWQNTEFSLGRSFCVVSKLLNVTEKD